MAFSWPALKVRLQGSVLFNWHNEVQCLSGMLECELAVDNAQAVFTRTPDELPRWNSMRNFQQSNLSRCGSSNLWLGRSRKFWWLSLSILNKFYDSETPTSCNLPMLAARLLTMTTPTVKTKYVMLLVDIYSVTKYILENLGYSTIF